MRFSKPLLLLTPLLLIAGCSSKTAPPTNQAEVEAETKAEVPSKPQVVKQEFSKILEGNFRGQFSFGDGQGYFKACDANKEFLVNANFALRNIYEQVTTNKFTPVYIEFTGEITFPTKKNKADDSVMRVDRVHHMALAKASLQCAKPIDTFLFKANGDEPYWRLNIDDEQKLYFATKASNQAYAVKDSNFRTTQINHVNTTNKKGQRLKLVIKPGHCYNLKNKEYWGYTTNVETIWGNFSGCGEPGWPIEDQVFTGYYLDNSNGKNINLTLNPNYTVVYKEVIGDKTIIKSGFWKNNSPDRVVVMLTKQDDKNIREEVIFNRSGLRLNSSTINRNNVVTPLAYPGFVFNRMNAEEGIEEKAEEQVIRSFTPQHINPNAEVDLEVQKAVKDYFKIHRTDPRDTKFSSIKFDLNDDGIKEAIVLLDWCSAKGCEMLIFEGRKNGYRFSSRVSRVQAPIIVASKQQYLWQSLLTNKGSDWKALDFDGISYPTNTKKLHTINKESLATGVILFQQGRPSNWFPIK